jgi:hypothetical protein
MMCRTTPADSRVVFAVDVVMASSEPSITRTENGA